MRFFVPTIHHTCGATLPPWEAAIIKKINYKGYADYKGYVHDTQKWNFENEYSHHVEAIRDCLKTKRLEKLNTEEPQKILLKTYHHKLMKKLMIY